MARESNEGGRVVLQRFGFQMQSPWEQAQNRSAQKPSMKGAPIRSQRPRVRKRTNAINTNTNQTGGSATAKSLRKLGLSANKFLSRNKTNSIAARRSEPVSISANPRGPVLLFPTKEVS